MRRHLLEEAPTQHPARSPAARRPCGPASSVLALQHAAGNRAVGAMLARQPAIKAPPKQPAVVSTTDLGPHELRVTLDDGSRHHVTRRARARLVTDPGAPDISFHGDAKRAWMRVSWCRGTKGTIDVGADPQDAATQLLGRIGQAIAKGGSTSDVIKAVEETQLKPFAKIDIASSGNWKITGDVQVQVNRLGVPGFETGLTIDLGPVRIKPSVSGSDLQGPAGRPNIQGGVTVEVDLGRRPPRHDCEPKTVDILWDYTCTREHDVVNRVTIQPPDIPREHSDSVHVYFPYRRSVPETDRSQGQLDHLTELLDGGYRIVGVDGFASPEGPQDARKDGSFEGNRALSQARADAAFDLMKRRCALRMRECMDKGAAAVGQGEKYPLAGTRPTRGGEMVVEEAEGAQLHNAVAEAFVKNADEMGRLPEEEQRRIREAKTAREKARLIYPWLRRAEVRLQRNWTEHPAPVVVELPDVRLDAEDCPEVVVRAADAHWGPRDPRRQQR